MFILVGPVRPVDGMPVGRRCRLNAAMRNIALAAPHKGKMNEKITATFDVVGAYGVKCAPHVGMGMVGLLVVGDAPANLEAYKERCRRRRRSASRLLSHPSSKHRVLCDGGPFQLG